MAAYGPAVNRIKYLITGEYPGPAYGWLKGCPTSPATISGGPEAIYSYRLRIAHKDDQGRWHVIPAMDSVTTNRHIRAVGMALEELGYTCDDGRAPHEIANNGATWTMPMN